MNIISAMVTLSVIGTAAPGIMNMSIAPAIAQKRADNLTLAESRAVTFAGVAEANQSLPDIPDGCSVSDPIDSVYTINCTEGSGQFSSAIQRSFRIAPEIEDGGSGGREFTYETPEKYSGHQCPTHDTFGVHDYNDDWSHQLGGACKPLVIWTEANYLASDPDSWLYDINGHNGWGNHPDY